MINGDLCSKPMCAEYKRRSEGTSICVNPCQSVLPFLATKEICVNPYYLWESYSCGRVRSAGERLAGERLAGERLAGERLAGFINAAIPRETEASLGIDW